MKFNPFNACIALVSIGLFTCAWATANWYVAVMALLVSQFRIDY
jgi:hypothetical protein